MDPIDEAPASSMLPPQSVRPRANRRFTPEEWEAQKPFIVGMYPMDGMTLTKIADFLHGRGFDATERQLKRKISNWKLDKKVKGHEMKSIVRKQARLKLKGKTAAFRVRGQPVPQHKIDRWEKTPGNCQVDVIAQELADSPCPTTPTMSVISYNALSERGSMSPYVPFRRLDEDIGEINLMVTEHPSVSSEGRAAVSRGFESEALIDPSPSGALVLIDAPSPFGGASPAPFTAPPSPAPSLMNLSSSIGLPGPGQPPILSREDDSGEDDSGEDDSGEDDSGEVVPYLIPPTALLPLISSRHETVEPGITVNPSKTRYRQRDEDELHQRRKEFVDRYGAEHPATLDTLSRLGDVYRDQGRLGEAERAFREVIPGREKVFGSVHARTISARTQLAGILMRQGKFLVATKLLKETSAMASTTLLATDVVFLELRRITASALREVGQYEESEALFHDVLLRMRQVWAAQTKLLGPDHPHTLRSRSLLGVIRLKENRYVEAEEITREVADKLARMLGPDLVHTLEVEVVLLQCLMRQTRYSEAETRGKKLMAWAGKHSGSSDVVEDIMVLVGRLHLAQGRIEDGRGMLERAAASARTHWGDEHPTTECRVGEYSALLQDMRLMNSADLVLKWRDRPYEYSEAADPRSA